MTYPDVNVWSANAHCHEEGLMEQQQEDFEKWLDFTREDILMDLLMGDVDLISEALIDAPAEMLVKIARMVVDNEITKDTLCENDIVQESFQHEYKMYLRSLEDY